MLDEVDSTMAEAARRASGAVSSTVSSAVPPTWILALRQSAARGRRGRRWVSPEGNFAATLSLGPTGPSETVALFGFVAGLALVDALVAVTGRADAFTLKWPNDVLLNGGKLAGILLESVGREGGSRRLSIGIGVNLADAPAVSEVEAGALRPVSLVGETGHAVHPCDLLAALAPAFAGWERRFVTYGFAPVRETWLARAARLGRRVTARTPSEEVTGVFETVDASGALVLRTSDSRRSIAAADVFF